MIVAPLIASLTPEALAALPEHRAGMLRYAWDLFARGSQKPPPGDWVTWLYMAGRGAGKTRTASEWIRQRVYDGAQRIALVGRTPADVRDVMIEGDSGLLNPTFPIWLNIPLSKSSAFFKPLSICETLAVGMAIITP